MLKKIFTSVVTVCTGILGAASAGNSSWMPSYDESKVPSYALPELLECKDGRVVTSADEWKNIRRPEILADFEKLLYGRIPEKAVKVEYELLGEKKDAVNGKAVRKEVRIHFTGKNQQKFYLDILLYLPSKASGKVPVFVGLNFKGNHAVEKDPDLRLTGLKYDPSAKGMQSAEKERGSRAHRFPLETIIDRGYALATACYHDIFPDRKDGWQDSIYTLFYSKKELKNPPREKYSAIGAWSWGLSRIMDYLETVPQIDPAKAVVFGHSRLGKTSLWAGANDLRFKLICANDSGSGGAALTRRLFGETLYSMFFVRSAPGNWWFVSGLKPYADGKVDQLPFDQHMLIALAAPRAIAVHSATEDLWADPKGEFLSAYHAGKVFELYGKEPLKTAEMPAPETPVGSDVSYFLRTGKHELLLADWLHYLDMADRIFK